MANNEFLYNNLFKSLNIYNITFVRIIKLSAFFLVLFLKQKHTITKNISSFIYKEYIIYQIVYLVTNLLCIFFNE